MTKSTSPQLITDNDDFATWQSAVAQRRTELSFSDFTRYNERVNHPLSTEFSLKLMVAPTVFNQTWRTHPREVIAQSLRHVADAIDGTNLADDDHRNPPGDFPVWILGTRVGRWAFTNLPEDDPSWLHAVSSTPAVSNTEVTR